MKRKLKINFNLAYLLIGFFCCFYSELYSQDQQKSDSLKQIYNENVFLENEELQTLLNITREETDADEKKKYSKILLEKAKSVDSFPQIYNAYLQIGNVAIDLGNPTEALDAYFEALKVAETNNYKRGEEQNSKLDLATINVSIADVYSVMGNSETAIRFYKQAISLLKKLNSPIDMATAELNLGDEYYIKKELDSALMYYEAAKKVFIEEDIEYVDYYVAYVDGNEGLVYAESGEIDKAEEKLSDAIKVLLDYEDYPAVSEYLNGVSVIYAERGNTYQAFKYAKESLKMALDNGLKDQAAESYLKVSELYEKTRRYKPALENFKLYKTYKDSVIDQEKSQIFLENKAKDELNEVNRKAEIKDLQQEADIKRNKLIALSTGIVLILIGVLSYFLFKRNKFMKKTNKIIEAEKQRSDDLLMNILPEETAQELKDNGAVTAKRFESVSVLFTDFKGFTAYSEKLSPEDLVKSIDYYFSKFDDIIEKHELEKIKTVGDAYMCACGLPFKDKDHAYKITKAGLDIIKVVEETKKIDNDRLAKFDIRVGINSGPVVSGVVGTKKFAYDIWGDTVNTAARMESSSEIGRLNISQSTYKLLKDKPEFSFEHRGAIEAKGKGKIDMYFVDLKEDVISIHSPSESTQ